MKQSSKIHVIGAGLAGLSAACRLAELGHQVVISEAAPQAGGRARSYFDKQLGCRIDNGNHLLLSGNASARAYLRRVGAEDALTGPGEPVFPFRDLATGESWVLRPNAGRLPWWIFVPSRRVPGTKPGDYLALLRLKRAGRADTVAPLAGSGALYKKLLEPLAISALNTMPDIAAAHPLAAVIAETLERGGRQAIPLWAKDGLSETFVDPALDWLRGKGADIRLGERVTEIPPGPVVLAVPPWVAKELVPDLTVPTAYESICNLHFRATMPPGPAGFWGLVGGMAEWVFARPDVVSVTISAANRYQGMDNDALARLVWAELASTFELNSVMPPYRLLWEKRATIAATPEQLALRPGPRTARPTLALAGDWTDTGLPCTIEGAIRSGALAAETLHAA